MKNIFHLLLAIIGTTIYFVAVFFAMFLVWACVGALCLKDIFKQTKQAFIKFSTKKSDATVE